MHFIKSPAPSSQGAHRLPHACPCGRGREGRWKTEQSEPEDVTKSQVWLLVTWSANTPETSVDWKRTWDSCRRPATWWEGWLLSSNQRHGSCPAKKFSNGQKVVNQWRRGGGFSAYNCNFSWFHVDVGKYLQLSLLRGCAWSPFLWPVRAFNASPRKGCKIYRYTKRVSISIIWTKEHQLKITKLVMKIKAASKILTVFF